VAISFQASVPVGEPPGDELRGDARTEGEARSSETLPNVRCRQRRLQVSSRAALEVPSVSSLSVLSQDLNDRSRLAPSWARRADRMSQRSDRGFGVECPQAHADGLQDGRPNRR